MKKTEKQYISILKKANEDYYNGESDLSDEDYDKLYDEFKKLYPKSKFFSEVGAKVQSTFKIVKHKIPMGSLLKVNNEEELDFWFKKYAESKETVWSEKVDGLSVSLYYKDGSFTQAVTRGDGSEGEDVTENVRKMKFLKTLKKKYTGFIRGEIVLTKDLFKKHFSDKANPRNAASGSVRRLDGEKSEHLTVLCYYIETPTKTEEQRFKLISDLGLKTPAYGVCKTIEQIQKVWQKYEDKARESAEYEIDGICVYVNSIADQEELGSVDNRPRYARAYKFSPQSAISTLEEVSWQVGRTGRITPVAKITPVNVAGALIKNVSLHNLAEIARKNVSIGAVIHVERKGDVIPQITKSVGEGTPIDIPTKCPSCASKLVKEDIFLLCTNPKCPEQNIQNLLFWLKTLDIKGFGDKMVEKLYNEKIVTKIEDFYSLTETQISELERSGEKLAKKLILELHSKKSLEPELFIKALGVQDLGESVSKLILEKHKFEDIFILTHEDLVKIHGIGKETATTVVEGLQRKKSEIGRLLKIISLKEKKQGRLSGKAFCFSEVRDKALEQRIKDEGGTVSDSVNKGLTALIVKSAQGTSSKIEKAKKNNIPVIAIADAESIFK